MSCPITALFVFLFACSSAKTDTAAPADSDNDTGTPAGTDSGGGSGGDSGGDSGGGGASVTVSPVASGSDILDATPTVDGEYALWIADDGATLCGTAMSGTDTPVCVGGVASATNLVATADGAGVVLAAQVTTGENIVATSAAVVLATELVSYIISRGVTSYSDYVILSASVGYAPTALDLVGSAGAETLYFSGIDPTTSQPGVFKMPLSDTLPEAVAVGFADQIATGLVVAADGTVYAAVPEDNGLGSLFVISEGVATKIATDIVLGTPAGLALTPDDSTVMVSSLSAVGGTSQVVLVDRASGATSIFNDVIGANVGSGGLHRARATPTIYAWCGVTTGGGGQVYKVDLGG